MILLEVDWGKISPIVCDNTPQCVARYASG